MKKSRFSTNTSIWRYLETLSWLRITDRNVW